MVIIMASTVSSELEAYTTDLFKDVSYHRISTEEMLHAHVIHHYQKNSLSQFVFVADLDAFGLDLAFSALVQRLMSDYPSQLMNASGLLIVKSDNQWHTKTFASWLLFNLNFLGCRFMGHPVIEMTKNLENLNQWEKTTGLDRETLLLQLSHKTLHRFQKPMKSPVHLKPKITALHASSRSTSNTLSLWNMVKQRLEGCDVQEYHVANGTIMDCIGCPYQTCLYFGRQQSCFYGGDIVKELFPAIEQSDALVWICPNYNDSLSANLMAVINRLTALYRTQSFYDKKIYAVIVSGNSGSDAVGRQLIDALCINKGFQLPPTFSLTATAYDPGSIFQVAGIEKRAAEFAALMKYELLSSTI